EGEEYWDMIIHPKRGRKALPLVDILTISATGSEFDNGGVISNLKTKEKIGAGLTFPVASICDPRYTYSVSPYQTAAGSIDIMSHVLEGYFSRTEDSIMSDYFAEAILKTVIDNLPIALKDPNNYSARANLMLASSYGCSGMPEYGKEYSGWPCHAMEHQLSAFYDITHGVGLAILTPKWMRYIVNKDSSTLSRFVRFAENVWNIHEGSDIEKAYKGIDCLENFFRESGIPMSLKEVNIDETHFEEMAIQADRNKRLSTSYVPLEKEDVIEIFKACL
ncbi:MAG: iron-containing alcohol dehydrogenase, partial [Solobacterium sp.]|nr:iron-containing alcohol dehydrogenase [Solobacterium sp.]